MNHAGYALEQPAVGDGADGVHVRSDEAGWDVAGCVHDQGAARPPTSLDE